MDDKPNTENQQALDERKAVTYGTIDGFVADVVNSDKTQNIVTEWRDYVQKNMLNKIQEMQAQWEEFTGWRYLREGLPL